MADPITRDSVPGEARFQRFRKTYRPLATRMAGSFACLTSEGNVAACDDGWLAIDSQGFPYPIGADEFAATYELSDAP